ncbi:MAG TPA: energy-coupling factor ABC transporter permease [Cryptosporangiaceae bacterium]|nr:energy-coupling factor ABC transporter permease [Cryptosporangiaceae bacterium]
MEGSNGIAMHISDGIIDLPASALFGVLAIGWLALCLARARADLDDRLAPMAGLLAAFIFAVQMLNFPVLPGVSGHLLGGALAVILVGPWVGALCVALVLLVQALLFADGGLSALGLNITNMAILTTVVAYGVVWTLLRVLPRTKPGLTAAAFVAALVSVVAGSQGFVLQYALGGTTSLPVGAVAGAMGGYHLLIGIGEGLITAATVGAVAAVRPDLVYALRGFRRAVVLETAPSARPAPHAPASESAAA